MVGISLPVYVNVASELTESCGLIWFPSTPFFAHSQPFERIDLIFAKGLEVVSVEDILTPGQGVNQFPYFASDHAGVLAVFQF